MKRKDENRADMTTGPLLKKMILFALPVLATGALQLLYNSADLVVVGQCDGKNASAAISSTSSLVFLLVCVFMGLAVGINVTVAQSLGAKNYARVEKLVHTAILSSLIFGVIVGAVGVIFSKQFLIWMQSPDDVIDLSTTYMRIFFLGTPVNLLYNFGAAIMRARGDSTKPLIFLTFSGLLNVGLNLIFVIFLKMSVAGVAIATIVSQFVSSVLVLISLVKNGGECKISLKKLRIDGSALWEITKIGLPAGLQSAMFSISNVLIQSTINSYGSVVMAGNGAATTVEGFVNTGCDAIYQAEIAFIGQNYGAGKTKNIKKIIWNSLLMMTVMTFVMAGGVLILDDFVLSLIIPDQAAIEIGKIRMIVLCGAYLTYAYMTMMVGVMRGLGHGLLPMIVSVLGVCGLRVLWLYTVYPLVPVEPITESLNLLYISYPVSWILTGLAHLATYLAVRKKTFAMLETPKTDLDTFEESY